MMVMKATQSMALPVLRTPAGRRQISGHRPNAKAPDWSVATHRKYFVPQLPAMAALQARE
jgi:hypothetical protein